MPNWVKNVVCIESPDLNEIKKIKDFFGDLNFDSIVPTPETLNITSGSTSSLAFNMYMSLLHNKGIILDEFRTNQRYKCFWELPLIQDPKNPISEIGLRSEDVSYLYKTPEDLNDHKAKDPKCRGDFIILGRIQYINILRYGSKDWYEYNCNNWGTKWSASYQWDDYEKENYYKEFYDNGVYMIRYEFRTAWNIPYGILDEFLFNFGYKYIKLNWQWADEDYGNNLGWLLKDYNHNAMNFYQTIPIPIKDEDLIKYSCMLWNDDYNTIKEYYEENKVVE